MSYSRFYTNLALLFMLTGCTGHDENEIRQKAKNYEDAFNRKDAKALSALWSQKAEYTNPESGEVISGRENIEKEFEATFQDKEPRQIELKIESIAFPRNDQAVESGVALIKQGDELIHQTAYKATYEKEEGKWLLSKVREVELMSPPDQHAHLKELEWLIGDWIDQDEDVLITQHNEWDKNKNFLIQKFSVRTEDQLTLEGKQVIGWDPIKKEIRSWIFDSDGTFGEGVWKKKDKAWMVEMVQTLADGNRASATNIYTPIDEKSYQWESVDREVGGEILPTIGPITIRKR